MCDNPDGRYIGGTISRERLLHLSICQAQKRNPVFA